MSPQRELLWTGHPTRELFTQTTHFSSSLEASLILRLLSHLIALTQMSHATHTHTGRGRWCRLNSGPSYSSSSVAISSGCSDLVLFYLLVQDPVIEVIISGRFGREERTKDGRHQHLCHQVDQLHHHEGLREQRFLSGPKQLKKIAPTPQRRVELYKTSEVVRAKYLLLGVPSATPPIGFRRLPMAGRHRNRLPHSFPRGGGNHPPPPPLHQPHLPPHHLDDLREPPRLPPHHLDDFRDPPRLLPGHPDNFREPLPPHYHFAAHGGGPLPPAPHVVAVLEERLGAEIEEAHALLGQNQRLAATHVALVQEVSAVRHEIGRTARGIAAAQDEGDLRLREVYEWLMKMEAELRAVEEMRAEHAQVRLDIQKLGAARQELMGQVQGFTQDLARSAVDLQQVAALKAEIQQIRHETQHLRSGIELEKKGYAENYEQGQEMQKKLISVASEVEKLRAGVANAEKRSRAAVSAGNQGYGGSFGNPNANYIANPYNAGYSMNQANAGDSGSQYGPGSMHSSWGVYDMQRASGRR